MTTQKIRLNYNIMLHLKELINGSIIPRISKRERRKKGLKNLKKNNFKEEE